MRDERVDRSAAPEEAAFPGLWQVVLDTLGIASQAAKTQPHGRLLDSLSTALADLARLCAAQEKETDSRALAPCAGEEQTAILKESRAQLKLVAELARRVDLEVRQRALCIDDAEVEELNRPGF